MHFHLFPLLLAIGVILSATAVEAKIVDDSVMSVRVRYSELNLKDVPQYSSYNELMTAFKYIRDTKFLNDGVVDRKIPWLYVKDFCHVRAQHAVNELETAGFVKPKKVFLHGILDIHNPYFQLKEGEIIWQHIALIASAEGIYYVLDPAIDMNGPIQIHQWVSSMTTDYDKIMIAICDGSTFTQVSSCYSPKPNDPSEQEQLEQDTKWALRFEWNTIKNKGFDPTKILLK